MDIDTIIKNLLYKHAKPYYFCEYDSIEMWLKFFGKEISAIKYIRYSDLLNDIKQLIEILTSCLVESENFIVLNYPENFLHSSFQSKLSDFFLCMIKSNKKIVVETHSEHLIKRLLLRNAQSDIRDNLEILFVKNDNETIPIQINEFGEIENWPFGFLDIDDSTKLMYITLKNRKNHMKK